MAQVCELSATGAKINVMTVEKAIEKVTTGEITRERLIEAITNAAQDDIGVRRYLVAEANTFACHSMLKRQQNEERQRQALLQMQQFVPSSQPQQMLGYNPYAYPQKARISTYHCSHCGTIASVFNGTELGNIIGNIVTNVTTPVQRPYQAGDVYCALHPDATVFLK